jgi:hypothetical protein
VDTGHPEKEGPPCPLTPRERSAKRVVQPLPPNTNPDKQRKLAKALARNYWRGFPEAFARVRALYPKPPGAGKFRPQRRTGCGDDARTEAVLAVDPRVVERASGKVLRQVAGAARNNNVATVRAMLRRGFPVTALSQHGAMPLHSAAFHGNLDMVENV